MSLLVLVFVGVWIWLYRKSKLARPKHAS
ncbi:MAG: CcoQ/FixQ family Cbb3-type cytochrome c oxidase assembly chaperone [Methylotenera sp.]|nr:CcoQ/FixQ family Cbb3-type cytochrome c oxidase assembly chaperone [Methylotenera sp.]